MSVQIIKRQFNVTEYNRMAETGILSEDDRVELIEGEIIEMSPIGSRHAACVRRLDATLNQRLGGVAQVSAQNPILLDDYSEPEPDVALLKPRSDFYAEAHPSPSDVLLIVEVADTSVEYDRQVKAPLYARAGIPEMWLVNLPEEMIEVYARPENGAYRSREEFTRGQSLSSTTIPDLKVNVEDILG
ncbi:MAG TPA: Uma2 family endonuclease [Pyrinomonadaceae bacterium]|jgi:Uma2 family endonuclease|nr:Uma2 family endonuclease [Pyrinomonadaceae bacterium]